MAVADVDQAWVTAEYTQLLTCTQASGISGLAMHYRLQNRRISNVFLCFVYAVLGTVWSLSIKKDPR